MELSAPKQRLVHTTALVDVPFPKRAVNQPIIVKLPLNLIFDPDALAFFRLHAFKHHAQRVHLRVAKTNTKDS